MRISDWSSDVCSSDLLTISFQRSVRIARIGERLKFLSPVCDANTRSRKLSRSPVNTGRKLLPSIPCGLGAPAASSTVGKRSVSEIIASVARRSEEHTSELQSLMRSSYAVFCLKKKAH